MIYFLYGTNKDKARAKANELVQSLLKKRPDASFFKMTAENWSEAVLAEYIGGQGLFVQKYIVLLDGLFENKELKELITKVVQLKAMQESPHVFIFREDAGRGAGGSGGIDKATLTKFEKYADKVQEFMETETKAEKAANSFGNNSFGNFDNKSGSSGQSDFNIFALSDAFGARDRKKLWVLYRKAKKAGLEDEQIHGTLFWQVKNMIIASEAKTAGEAKLNPFVFSKARGFTQNWQAAELAALSDRLISLYHDSRRGIHDLDHALERFVLTI